MYMIHKLACSLPFIFWDIYVHLYFWLTCHVEKYHKKLLLLIRCSRTLSTIQSINFKLVLLMVYMPTMLLKQKKFEKWRKSFWVTSRSSSQVSSTLFDLTNLKASVKHSFMAMPTLYLEPRWIIVVASTLLVVWCSQQISQVYMSTGWPSQKTTMTIFDMV